MHPCKQTCWFFVARREVRKKTMEEILIASVFKREPLWNPAHELHKNVVILKKLWEEVAIEVEKDGKY